MQVELDLVDAHDAWCLCDRRIRRREHEAPGQVCSQQEKRLFAARERIEGDVGSVLLEKQSPFTSVGRLARLGRP